MLVVHDSAVVRQSLVDVVAADPQLSQCGIASNPYLAVEKIKQLTPHVIITGLVMAKMDGVTFIEKVMQQHPIPIIVCTALDESESPMVARAIQAGAIEVIKRPVIGGKVFFQQSARLICNSVKAAAAVRLKCRSAVSVVSQPKQNADAVIAPVKKLQLPPAEEPVLLLGASTGGTQALDLILAQMPSHCPGICIVQHMPRGFTAMFARRLNECCGITVQQAYHGQRVCAGLALIAPGNSHMLLRRDGRGYFVEIVHGPLVARHRPAVDVLFRSAAYCAGPKAVAAVLTGMGDDGAQGLLELRSHGAWTCNQDEASSVVYGMPKAARKQGGSGVELPLETIAQAMLGAAGDV
ncbi:chemotaxis response regulator protein-glutamate methylesterase [Halioxenophilus aromaticivorans]|uniref:Protein-glutamate methylesterase/protein-glutamine glutaminase n=1 Tax=Halioxenophilus aromaticivorans TaxID=1306992 RepID=A0AAV3U9B2_9ALTE